MPALARPRGGGAEAVPCWHWRGRERGVSRRGVAPARGGAGSMPVPVKRRLRGGEGGGGWWCRERRYRGPGWGIPGTLGDQLSVGESSTRCPLWAGSWGLQWLRWSPEHGWCGPGVGRGWWLLLWGNSRCHRGMGAWGDTGAPPAPRGRTDTGVGHPGYALPSPCWLEGPVGVRVGALSPPEVWASCGGVEPPPVFCVLPCLGVPCGHGAPCVPHPGLGILWMFSLLSALCPLPGWRSHVRPPTASVSPQLGALRGC